MNWSKVKIRIYNLSEWIIGKNYSEILLTRKYINFYRKQKLIFIHIPKAAGTSISNLIYGKRNGHLTAKKTMDLLGKDIFGQKKIFSVTRDPYDRLVSAYLFAIQGGSVHGAVNNPKLYKSTEFRDFDSFVKEWLVKQNLLTIDLIFRPQYTFIYIDDKCLVENVFKIENIEEINKFLQDVLGKTKKLPVLNKTKRPQEYMDYYTPESIEIVNKVYNLDFQLLNYDKFN